MFPLIRAFTIYVASWFQEPGLPNNLILLMAAVVAGVVVLLILIVVAARIFGRREGKAAKARRAPAAAASIPPTTAVPAGRGAEVLQPGQWLVGSDGQKISLNKLPLNIGRAKTNQLVIEHPSLADVHARIYFEAAENVFCIEDASDGNCALLVNGSPTRKSILSNQDRISLGDVNFQYQEAAPGQNSAAQG